MTQQTYTKKVARRLTCGKAKRKEFTRQLASDIESALESGESWDTIQKRLGSPAEIAKEINESLGAGKASTRKKRLLIGGLILGIVAVALIIGIIYFTAFRQDQEETRISDQAAIRLSGEVIERFSSGDYETILSLCDDKLKSLLSSESLQQIKEQNMPDSGTFLKAENSDPIRITEKNFSYTTVQLKADYANQTMIFTLSWNDQRQLCGFYLKRA